MNTRLWLAAPALVVGLAAMSACSAAKPIEPHGPRTFDSAPDAAAALFDAAQASDDAAMLAVLGPDAGDLVASGDAAEDRSNRQNFVEKYRQMHRIGLDAENRTALFIGAENWPFPIPLVQHDAKWMFDTDAGRQEVLYRRIGRNEAAAIQTSQELVAAEHEYFATGHDGGPPHQYAQHFVSTPGKHDGLFWEAASGETTDSPIGPLLSFATSEAASKSAHDGPTPFHGYYFRMLRAQGKNGTGGERSYIIDGQMTGGFAFLAYPAEYRSSGVMTFLVGPDGVVRQKDLGADTGPARAMTAFDPDPTWTRVE